MGMSVRFWITAALLTVIYLVGGRTTEMNTMVVAVAALMALAATIWLKPRRGVDGAISPWLMAIGVIALALPILHLIPLPAWLWHSLPGRQVETAALALVNADKSAMPLSITPYTTMVGLIATIPSVTLLFLVQRLDLHERVGMLAVIVALGMLATFVGALQLAGGDSHALRFYADTYGVSYVTAFNSNRNATAELLCQSLMAALALLWIFQNRLSMHRMAILWLIVMGPLFLMTVLTGSRSGTIVAVCVMLLSVALVPLRLKVKPKIIGASLVGLAALSLAAFFLLQNSQLNQTWQRFGTLSDATRAHIHEDTLYGIGQYWPMGSGMNSFETAFAPGERLEYVQRAYINRAHNDYLELAFEAGLPGLIALLVIAGIIVGRIAMNLIRPMSREQWVLSLFSAGLLSVLAIHSLVDYVVRTISVASIAAIAVGVLAPVASGVVSRQHSAKKRSGVA